MLPAQVSNSWKRLMTVWSPCCVSVIAATSSTNAVFSSRGDAILAETFELWTQRPSRRTLSEDHGGLQAAQEQVVLDAACNRTHARGLDERNANFAFVLVRMTESLEFGVLETSRHLVGTPLDCEIEVIVGAHEVFAATVDSSEKKILPAKFKSAIGRNSFGLPRLSLLSMRMIFVCQALGILPVFDRTIAVRT
eukprot:TRINITY_DN5030_c0_g1_i1.p2 TRINITY_DN5030_c0_g1~~TRINITY_DN5030_c0_g1_i1.p2  ORF type:complete len:194 (-),score=11.16 TRINITY_DN5030_c0_g1_i1:118-699(-)